MITVTRLNGQSITINALMIETIENTPDTLISLTTGKRLTVRESGVDVVDLIKQYMSSINYIRLDFKTKEEQ
jgi:flagellar protein FlbD